MKIRLHIMRWLLAAITVAVAGSLSCGLNNEPVGLKHAMSEPRLPRISPDYQGTVIPPNIAPLNFIIQEPGAQYAVRIHSTAGTPITIVSRNPKIIIPIKPWRKLLQDNQGQGIQFDIAAKSDNGQWRRFETVTNTISRDKIDSHLAYRLLNRQFSMYASGTIGIFQRNLENYDQTTVLRVRDRRGGGAVCVNCHTFLNNRPAQMALHIRTQQYGRPTLLVRDGKVINLNKTAGYLSWHPSGDLLAFSVNKLSLFFHSIGENRDVFDAKSDLGVYDVRNNTVEMPSSIAQPARLETWPGWSADGKCLYFCSAKPLPLEQFQQVRYDLMRVSYDHENRAWGEPETVLSANETGLSIGQPKASPDGNFLLFCMYPYGNFPVYQKASDLYLMDLQSGKYRRLEINSDETDSWHCWSSNSRWIVFSSKRRDGVFARPHFSYVDNSGNVHKPFILPQEDPAFYDHYIMTFNVPELFAGPIPVSQRELQNAVFAPRNRLAPEDISPVKQPEQEQTEQVVPAGAPYARPAK